MELLKYAAIAAVMDQIAFRWISNQGFNEQSTFDIAICVARSFISAAYMMKFNARASYIDSSNIIAFFSGEFVTAIVTTAIPNGLLQITSPTIAWTLSILAFLAASLWFLISLDVSEYAGIVKPWMLHLENATVIPFRVHISIRKPAVHVI